MSILPLSTPSMRTFLVLPRPCAPLTRSFASSVRYRKTPPSDFVLDQEPARAARQAAEEASRRKNVGPFPMGQPAQDGPPRRPWHDLGGGERLGRLVVLFGVTVSGLVIYAVSSELFATNSPTKIFEQCTEMLKRDDETKSILLEPIRYHAESSGGRRNRRVLSSMSVDAATGREKMTVKFAVEGKAPDAPVDETYWHRFKRWIRPVIAEPSDASALIPTPPNRERVVKPEDDPPKSWISSMFGSILPSALGGSSSTSSSPTPPSARLRSKPPKGTFSGGEAIAVLLLDDKGVFNLQSLTVYYPNAREWQWKTDVRSQAKPGVQASNEGESGATRYRFWHR